MRRDHFKVRDNRRPGHAWFYVYVLKSFAGVLGFRAWGVYTSLCCYAGNEDAKCHPSLAHLAATWKVSKPTIKRAIRKLCEFGLVHRKKNQGPSTYTLLDVFPKKGQSRGIINDPSDGSVLIPQRDHQRSLELDFFNYTSLTRRPLETSPKRKGSSPRKRGPQISHVEELENQIAALKERGLELMKGKGPEMAKSREVRAIANEIDRLGRQLVTARLRAE